MGKMKVQRRGTKNESAQRHVCRQFSTNYLGRYFGRDTVGTVLSVTCASPDGERSRSRIVVHPKLKIPAVATSEKREREDVRMPGVRSR